MAAQLTIQIVGFNGAQHLQRAVAALRKIPQEEAEFRYIDNGSSDSSVQIVRQALPQADIVVRTVNTGFTGGHNLGFSLCTTPYVLVHDQDVVIEWENIKMLLNVFQDTQVAAVQGKLYRADARQTFDTAGIVQTLSLNGIDRGANEEDHGQFNESAHILAAQGACALYRTEALLAVAHTRAELYQEVPDIFDEDFFAYKDDTDLGWRLSTAGWKVLYQPVVAGYHARTLGKRGIGGWGLNPKTIYERLQGARTRYSLRNYCWMIVKNVNVGQLMVHSPFILGRLWVFFMLTLMYPPLLSVWKEIWQGIPKMLAKRL